MSLLRLIAAAALAAAAPATTAAAPRLVRVSGRQFVLAATGAPITLVGPNVVVKGPPYLPTVVADAPVCDDVVDGGCAAAGNCTSCTTCGLADVANFRARGWNALRLGVVWAGAQPRDENALDAAFLARLHALLNLTDAAGLAVILDNHGDMVTGMHGSNSGKLQSRCRCR